MPKKIGIIGSTGSIGTQALDVVRLNPDRYEVVFLSCNSNITLLKEQAEEFRPKYICITGDCHTDGALLGLDSLLKLIREEELDLVLLAAVGAAGILPAYETVKRGIDLALANKESIVAAGSLILSKAKETGSRVIPVDSEHSAIFQCLHGQNKEHLNRIVLTASGGAFRNTPLDALGYVTKAEALKHPNWSMGAKITVDSATMMNKGLELIEARFLFDTPPDKLDVVIHPQSVVHSFVTFRDGSMIAQMGDPDMRTPISYAMAYPERTESGVKPLDMSAVGMLTFSKPDLDKYLCLKTAMEVLKNDKAAPMIIMNAANEVAVEAFIKGGLKYLAIPELIKETLNVCDFDEPCCVEAVLETDIKAREASFAIFTKGL
ncbi:MAG: 1-deoxy-D-xylulose-5-phosphate reductoisomerase [Deferribacterales bacterium]